MTIRLPNSLDEGLIAMAEESQTTVRQLVIEILTAVIEDGKLAREIMKPSEEK